MVFDASAHLECESAVSFFPNDVARCICAVGASGGAAHQIPLAVVLAASRPRPFHRAGRPGEVPRLCHRGVGSELAEVIPILKWN